MIVVKSYYIEIWFHISYSATWDENSVQSWNYHDEVSMPSAKKKMRENDFPSGLNAEDELQCQEKI